MAEYTIRKQMNGMTKMELEDYIDDVELESLYQWIDRIPLSRPKKDLRKDFSDGVLAAEVVKHYFPKDVELHNYAPAASTKQKINNWYLFNRKVLRRFDLELSDDVMRAVANQKPKVIVKVLMLLRLQIDKRLERTGRDSLWRRRELFYVDPLPLLDTNQEEENTPHGSKSPRGQIGDASSRTLSPARLTKSEPVTSPRKYNKGEIPHGHPDRTSYLADKPLSILPRQFLPPVSDNIPRLLYEEKEMECHAKEETIQILNAKIRRLEHLLHLKDVRIDDLASSLHHTIGMGYSTRKR